MAEIAALLDALPEAPLAADKPAAQALLEEVCAGASLVGEEARLLALARACVFAPVQGLLVAALVIHALRETDTTLLDEVTGSADLAPVFKYVDQHVWRAGLAPWPLFERLVARGLLKTYVLRARLESRLKTEPASLLAFVEELMRLPACEGDALRLARRSATAEDDAAVLELALPFLAGDARVAREAAELIVELHRRGVELSAHEEALREALSSEHDIVRRALAEALGTSAGLLEHADAQVRLGAFNGLCRSAIVEGELADERACELVICGLGSEDDEIRQTAAKQLAGLARVPRPSDAGLRAIASGGSEEALVFIDALLYDGELDADTRALLTESLSPAGLAGALRERIAGSPQPPRCEICAPLARELHWREHQGPFTAGPQLARLIPPIPPEGAPTGEASSRCPECGHWFGRTTVEDHRGIYSERDHRVTRLTPDLARSRLRPKQLRSFEDQLPALVERARRESMYPQHDARVEAAWWLARVLASEEDWSGYLELLGHAREEVRLEALKELAPGWPAALRPGIEAALDSDDAAVRERGASLLAAAGEVDALLAGDDPSVLRGVVRRMGAEDTRRHAQRLAELMSHDDLAYWIRRLLGEHLELSDAEALRPALERLLDDASPHVRRAAAKLISALVRKGWSAAELAPRVAEILDER